MTSQSNKPRGQMTFVVDASPEIVDAGGEVKLHGRLFCTPACDLRGEIVSIRDETGVPRGSVEFTGFDGETNETDEFVVKAPAKTGGYTWLAVCPAMVKQGVSYAETSAPISF